MLQSRNEMQLPDAHTSSRAYLVLVVHTRACLSPFMVHVISRRVQSNRGRKRSRNGADVPLCTIRHYHSATRLKRKVRVRHPSIHCAAPDHYSISLFRGQTDIV